MFCIFMCMFISYGVHITGLISSTVSVHIEKAISTVFIQVLAADSHSFYRAISQQLVEILLVCLEGKGRHTCRYIYSTEGTSILGNGKLNHNVFLWL